MINKNETLCVIVDSSYKYILMLIATHKIMQLGVYITSHKKKEINWLGFLECCNRYNKLDIINSMLINVVDITKDNYNKLKFDKIITKVDEYYMNNEENTDVVNYLASFPKIIDPISSQFNVGNRYIMAENLEKVCEEFSNLFVPGFMFAESKEKSLNYCPNLSFPIICKPNCCFGTKKAHSMCLVNSYEDLLNANIEYPSVLQEYLPHQKIIFKIYVIGSRYEVVIKNSIDYNGGEIVYFDTANIKVGHVELTPKQIIQMIATLKADIDIERLTQIIGRAFGLSLFGYDIIKTGMNKYGIIDVNFFPGYKCITKFNEYLLDFILSD